ncbi:macrophage colony-stimulating factor 1 receptor 2-like [Plectropomus leopardus]|uniref:macrophage colony-stimulating factor 1 receptor 2-like n=1 Tax=Plectropomus leopardus TaxID=160734 RepID=UPI001C4BE200|nr:macrophage colony-stimulating factor 1 receptor 2-like [Plectropomus leopardus]
MLTLIFSVSSSERPFLTIYLLQRADANVLSMQMELLQANISSESLAINRELIANVSTNRMEVNGDSGANVSSTNISSANISSSSTVEVHEGQDVRLTFVGEAYPPIRRQHWTTTTHDNNGTVHQESYTTRHNRWVASLLLRHVRQKDRGRYSYHFSTSFFNGSHNIDLQIYRAPSVIVRLKNGTLTCRSCGYPLPKILWYTCPGVHDTCGHVSTRQVLAAVTSQEEEEEARSHLSVPVSPDDDVTVECVASNRAGETRDVFTVRKAESVFTLSLIGTLAAGVFFCLLSLVLLVLWRQVGLPVLYRNNPVFILDHLTFYNNK